MKKTRLDNFLKNIKNMFPSSEENWKIILLCLMGATIFWFFNALNKEYSAMIRYPIEFIYNEEEAVVVDPLPHEIRLEVTGGGWNLLRKTFLFNVKPVQISLNEPTETKFLTAANLKPVFIDQVAEIRVDEVLLDTLRLHIEKKVSKSIPVKIDSSSIRLSPDHRIVSPIILSHDSVKVTGPVSQVNSLGNSLMLSLQNELINSNYFKNIDVSSYLPPKVLSDPAVITISFNVQQFLQVSKELLVQPMNFPKSASLKDSVVTASVYIARNDLNKLNSGQFMVVADYSKLNRKDSTINLRLMIYPDFISDISLDTKTVEVVYHD